MSLGFAAGHRRPVRGPERLTTANEAKKEPRQTARLWKVYREETPRKGKTLESVESQVSLQRTRRQGPIQPYTITRCYGVWALSGRRASRPTSHLRDQPRSSRRRA